MNNLYTINIVSKVHVGSSFAFTVQATSKKQAKQIACRKLLVAWNSINSCRAFMGLNTKSFAMNTNALKTVKSMKFNVRGNIVTL